MAAAPPAFAALPEGHPAGDRLYEVVRKYDTRLSRKPSSTGVVGQDRWLNGKELCAMIGFAYNSLRKRIDRGDTFPPFVIIGGRYRFRESDVYKWLSDNTVTPAKARARKAAGERVRPKPENANPAAQRRAAYARAAKYALQGRLNPELEQHWAEIEDDAFDPVGGVVEVESVGERDEDPKRD